MTLKQLREQLAALDHLSGDVEVVTGFENDVCETYRLTTGTVKWDASEGPVYVVVLEQNDCGQAGLTLEEPSI